jgi:flagellar protein FliO/FliZ
VELADLARSFGSLSLVLGFMWLAVWVLKKYRLAPGMQRGRKGSRPRVMVVSRTAVDPKHTLIMVRRDMYEHLVLLGPNGMLLIEQNIIAGARE